MKIGGGDPAPHYETPAEELYSATLDEQYLTQAEVAETLTHLAFYVGWPNVFSAMPVAKDAFEKRPR